MKTNLCLLRLLCAWLVACSCLAAAAEPSSDRRLALVIGNSAYKSSPLLNPANDARAMGQALTGLGFEVMQFENLGQKEFMKALRDFGNRLRETQAVGLFYYAGHGMQVKGSNYLIPVDAAIEGEEEIKYLAIDANQVLDKMEQAGNRLNIVILDACRDNPYARSFRSKQSGLAQMDAPSGMLIAFATAPGSVAYDGDGVNGMYTKHLLRNLALEGLPIELVLKRVREGVSKDTGQKQIPWESSSLLGDFYFKSGATQTNARVGGVDPGTVELAFWDSVKNSSFAGEYRAYLEQYPNGQFATLARSRMNGLLAKNPDTSKKNSASSATNQVALAQPASAIATRSAILAKVGDNWTYNLIEGGKKLIDLVTISITATDGESIEETITRDNTRGFGVTRKFTAKFDPTQGFQETELPGKYLLIEFAPYVLPSSIPAPGKEWTGLEAEISLKGKTGGKFRTPLAVRVIGEEKISVPAGTFNATRVEARGSVAGKDNAVNNILITYWYSPDVRRAIKINWRQLAHSNQVFAEDSFELSGYQQSR